MLKKKLTIEEQREILNALFGILIINEGSPQNPLFLFFDSEGFVFGEAPIMNVHGKDSTREFDVSTLEGIFAYTAYRAKEQGYADAQYNMRKALGL